MLATRATIWPSPVNVWYANWNASLVPQMLAPAPRTVNVPALYVDDPAWPVLPTSWICHGLGRPDAPVVKLHTGPVVAPTELRATICRKYVVPLVSAPGEYDAAACPADTCAGGLLVPKLTS